MAILEEVAWHLQICNSCFYQVSESWPAHGPLVMLNSAEHEICPANESQIANDCKFFLAKHTSMKFSLLMNIKMISLVDFPPLFTGETFLTSGGRICVSACRLCHMVAFLGGLVHVLQTHKQVRALRYFFE